jgi:hypothetical protein
MVAGQEELRQEIKDSQKDIWMETNGKAITGKTEIEMDGWCVWRPKGTESEKLEGISKV